MANWCENKVFFNGPKADLLRIKSLLTDAQSDFSLQAVIPVDEGDPNYVDLATEQWGTGGEDSGSVVLTEKPESLTYDFETAWTPPSPVIRKLAKQFPTVAIKHYYTESGVGFGGFDSYTNGEWIDGEEWESH